MLPSRHRRWTPEEYRQRPRDPDPRLCDVICERLSNGELLLDICADDVDMPLPATFMRWAATDPEMDRAYREALALQADVHIDEAVVVSRLVDPVSARVQLDALKFRVERMRPGKYGPRATLDVGEKEKDSAGGVDYGAEVRRKLELMAERQRAAREES